MDRAQRLQHRVEGDVRRACEAGVGSRDLGALLAAAFAALTDIEGACFHTADPATGIPAGTVRVGRPPARATSPPPWRA